MDVLRQLSKVTLALLVLFSSMGFTESRHYCMGELQSVSLFMHAVDCHKSNESPCRNKNNNNSKKGCCENKVVIIKGQNLETSVDHTINWLPELNFAPILLHINYLVETAEDKGFVHYYNFHPPPIIRDIPVLVQSFLL